MTTDIIRVRGIMSKGFGQISKFVMMNPKLSIGAKGVYGYFVSYTGGGNNTAFPGRDKIVYDLGVTKDTYYKYLKELLESGLITVTQQNCQSPNNRGFQRNIYTIELYPEELISKSAGEKGIDQALETVKAAGHIAAAGYGNVPKEVMTNPDISIQAKGVYSYISSFSGTDFKASPLKDVAAYHMNVSSGSYNKYCLELEEAGYVSRYQEKIGSRFGRTIFVLNQKINENQDKLSPIFPSVNNSDTVIPDPVKSYTQISDTKKSDTELSDTANPDTNRNGSKYNRTKSKTVLNTTGHNSARGNKKTSADDKKIDGMNIKTFIEKETDWENRSRIENYQGDNPAAEQNLFKLTAEAIVEMLTSKETMQLGGHSVTADMVGGSIESFIRGKTGNNRLTGLVDAVEEAFLEAAAKREISNVSGYLKTIIWTKLSTAGISGRASEPAKRKIRLTEF